jgi:hypothetical protein
LSGTWIDPIWVFTEGRVRELYLLQIEKNGDVRESPSRTSEESESVIHLINKLVVSA